MKNNKRFLKQRKPDPEAFKAMLEMYADLKPEKKETIKKFIKTFDLDLRGAKLESTEDFILSSEKIRTSRAAFNSLTQNQKPITMGKTEKFGNEAGAENQESKFNNSAEETPMREFLKFENVGDKYEGFINGESVTLKQDGQDKNYFIIVKDEKEFLLPNNVKLTRRIKNLLSIKNITPQNKKYVEVQIEYLGMVKVDGVANKMKDFAVRY